MVNEKSSFYANLATNPLYAYVIGGGTQELLRKTVGGAVILSAYPDLRRQVPDRFSEMTKSSIAGAAVGAAEVFTTQLVPAACFSRHSLKLATTSLNLGRSSSFYALYFPSVEFYQQCVNTVNSSDSFTFAVTSSLGAGALAGNVSTFSTRFMGLITQTAPKGTLFRSTLWGALLNVAINAPTICDKINFIKKD